MFKVTVCPSSYSTFKVTQHSQGHTTVSKVIQHIQGHTVFKVAVAGQGYMMYSRSHGVAWAAELKPPASLQSPHPCMCLWWQYSGVTLPGRGMGWAEEGSGLRSSLQGQAALVPKLCPRLVVQLTWDSNNSQTQPLDSAPREDICPGSGGQRA